MTTDQVFRSPRRNLIIAVAVLGASARIGGTAIAAPSLNGSGDPGAPNDACPSPGVPGNTPGGPVSALRSAFAFGNRYLTLAGKSCCHGQTQRLRKTMERRAKEPS
jgi:hypothetical protein